MKIRSVGVGRTGGGADVMKLTVAFRNFGNAPSDGKYGRALIKLNKF